MADLSTNYLGLKLKNPLIVSSSGLTNSVEKIVKLEEKGISAVVLKSLFEEQINGEISHNLRYDTSVSTYPEAEEYITNYIKDNNLSTYLTLISDSKKSTKIPIIASINCVSKGEWISFAKDIEEAGADALELNIYILPFDKFKKSVDYERIYFDVLQAVKASISIPVSMKLGMHFTNFIGFCDKLKGYGADGVVLFNRFYEPDVNIKDLTMNPAEVFSHPIEIRKSLRWVGIISQQINGLAISSSTGIHDSESIIKLLLVGADTIQLCSLLYKKGNEVIPQLIKDVNDWADNKSYKSVNEFRGTLSYSKLPNPAIYERSQFMKYFSNNELNDTQII